MDAELYALSDTEWLIAEGFCKTVEEAQKIVADWQEAKRQAQARVETAVIDFDKIIGTAFRQLKFVNESLRSEMRQTAIVEILEHVAKGGTQDQAYLIKIAYHAMQRPGRESGRKHQAPKEWFADRFRAGKNNKVLPVEENHEENFAVLSLHAQAVMDWLTDDERTLVYQVWNEGKKQGEIAGELKISQAAVIKTPEAPDRKN